MKPNRVYLIVWMLGIVATLAGALGGAAFNYFFGKQAAIEGERRSDVRKAAEDYFTKRFSNPPAAVGARFRLAFYASSDVVNKFAKLNRIVAEADTTESQRRELCGTQTPNGRKLIEAQMRFVAAVRNQTFQEDPLEHRDLAAVLCPAATQPCFGEQYVAHLFDCGAAGVK